MIQNWNDFWRFLLYVVVMVAVLQLGNYYKKRKKQKCDEERRNKIKAKRENLRGE